MCNGYIFNSNVIKLQRWLDLSTHVQQSNVEWLEHGSPYDPKDVISSTYNNRTKAMVMDDIMEY
jgi:hypothetical protein